MLGLYNTLNTIEIIARYFSETIPLLGKHQIVHIWLT